MNTQPILLKLAALKKYLVPIGNLRKPNVVVYSVHNDHIGECGDAEDRAHQFVFALGQVRVEEPPVQTHYSRVLIKDGVISGLMNFPDDGANELYFDNGYDITAKTLIENSARGRNVGVVGYTWCEPGPEGIMDVYLKDLDLETFVWRNFKYEAGIWKPAEPAIEVPKEETVMVAK